MSENNSQVHETSSASLKGIRHLLWVGVISVWAAMSLILYTASVNYQNYQEVRSMLKSQDTAALVNDLTANVAEINASVEKLSGEQEAINKRIREQVALSVQKIAQEIRAELSPNIVKMNESVEKLRREQKAITSEVGAELSANIAKMNESVEKLLREQKAIIGEIRTGLALNAESVEKLLGEQKAMTDKIRTGLASNAEAVGKLLGEQKTTITRAVRGNKSVLDESFQKLSGGQNAIIEEIKSDNLYNSEKMKLLKKFIENQTTLLNQLSGILAGPEAKPGAQE
ncbi:hypothetical protein QUF72_15740 [Desulfobacterales bacterium HSG2]|nr:hypothetical protein [Desulfobacterales bacterium HSG2]